MITKCLWVSIMRKLIEKTSLVGILLVVLCGSVMIAYAITRLFYSQNITSDFTKKQIFQFDLSSDMVSADLGPGESVFVNPVISNSATEKMYVFVVIESPEYDNAPLYEYDVNDSWVLVESDGGTEAFAYGGETLAVLIPGESTEPLISTITMRQITNAEFASIDDINISITGYAIDTNGSSADPAIVWNECKALR